MRKILITGLGSYIGTSLECYLVRDPGKYKVDTIDMMENSWKNKDFSAYDSVFHVAGIVHAKETKKAENLYYTVNRDLAVEVAKKAKVEGVRQFIFMSSMAVYGSVEKIGVEKIITDKTPTNPNSFYGKSKLEAEDRLRQLADTNFKIVILRPPIVYGPNCPGNYARLEKLAMQIPVFPMIENKRSMIHIDKLCHYLKTYIDYEATGLFFPQDDEYVNTSILVQGIAEKNGKKIFLSKSLGWFIKFIGKRIKFINKVFGNLVYEK